ncbi:MAG: hypothetical protein WCC97_13140 [Candidatus Acidiferrales bacterium]
MKKLAVGTAILAAAAIAFAGGDVWKAKSMDQWTDKDINEILATSPWAKAGVVPQGASTRPDGMTQATGSTGIAGSKSDTAHISAGADPQQNGASEKQDSAAANEATYSIFWWSSRTIRAASMRRAVLKGTMTEADAEKTVSNVPPEYMILVQGTNMQIFQHRGEQAFEKAAYLQLKKTKQKIYPTKVDFLKSADGNVNGVIFYFSKKGSGGDPTIAPEEKEIDFYLQMGGAKLYTYFDPRKMVDSKGEDL